MKTIELNFKFFLEFPEITVAALSFIVCFSIIIGAQAFPTLLIRSNHLQALQAMHIRSTSRIGGLGVFIAFIAMMLFVPGSVFGAYLNFIMAAGVLFLVGLAEDLGLGVPPLWRLFAAVFSSVLVVLLLGVWMPHAGIPGLDSLMSFWWVGVPITLLVTVGAANGFNLIDGVNGLAALTAIAAAVAMMMIADAVEYPAMVHLTGMLIAAILGFLVWNYPFGLIFLGDAGAYTLGFVLSWFAIGIMLHTPMTSPWAMLLTLFWPVADTLLAIWRRMRRKAPTMAPDRLHVHQLVMRALEIYVLGRGRRQIANPLTTLILAPFVIAPPTVGVLLWDNNQGAFLAVITFACLFFSSYTLSFGVFRRLRSHARIGSNMRTPTPADATASR